MTGLGERNLARAAELALERTGDYDALFHEGVWYRSAAQAERAARIGAGLRDLGVQPGDRVIVMMENSPDVGVVYQAIWRAGAAITPAIFLLAPQELHRIVSDSGAVAVITAPPFLDTIAKAAEGVGTLRWTICTGPAQPGTISLDDLAGHEPGELVPRADDDLALLLYTGGTTGQSKGVVLTQSNVWQAGWAGHQLRRPDIHHGISCLPLSHAFGVLGVAGSLHLEEPHTTVLMKWFEPTQWLRLAQDHHVQYGAMVPSMLYLLLQQPLEEYDLSKLEIIGFGAAPLLNEAREEVQRRLPGIEVREGYGLTESCGSACSMRFGRPIKPGTVGIPVPGCELKIFDDKDQELPVGEVGEICLRSGTVMKGYWNDPEQTAQVLKNGWLHTGDMGKVDADGDVTIVDRKKDLIIRGGFNVYPRDVEEALVEHPAIATAGVVGRPDPIHGEEVVAFVTLQPGASATAEEIVSWSKERLGGYKYPREVNILDALPLSHVGKLDRKALRSQLPVTAGKS
ncbi:MAG TPA: AMP-binding protein [Candidatus Solibacter sp.]|nr:AMP-binding protein [Candidatus Solibacter sp.]